MGDGGCFVAGLFPGVVELEVVVHIDCKYGGET